MLAGEPAFTDRTAQAIVAKRVSEPVPHLRTLRDVPEGVEQAVTKTLARSPADRFVDARQFAEALKNAATNRPPAGVRRGALMVVGALLAISAVFGLYRVFQPVPGGALDPNLLAVAPFDVLDPSLQLWRKGLGDILSRSLDGVGPLRTVSQTVALRRWRGSLDPASAEALGRRTGAGLLITSLS
jgi:serine/threonine-protein kinase